MIRQLDHIMTEGSKRGPNVFVLHNSSCIPTFSNQGESRYLSLLCRYLSLFCRYLSQFFLDLLPFFRYLDAVFPPSLWDLKYSYTCKENLTKVYFSCKPVSIMMRKLCQTNLLEYHVDRPTHYIFSASVAGKFSSA